MADDITLLRLNYDAQTGNAEFAFKGHRQERLLSVSGIVPVPPVDTMTESQINEATKEATRKLLRDLADSL